MSPKLFCTKCGAELTGTEKFCKKCGHKTKSDDKKTPKKEVKTNPKITNLSKILIVLLVLAVGFSAYLIYTQKQIISQKQSSLEEERTAKESAQQEAQVEQEKQKLLNEDKDGDGLTLRQENEKGTSDYDADSDSDGIPDGEDLHPAGGGRNIAKIYTYGYPRAYNPWTGTYYSEYEWTLQIGIPEDWYEYYKGKQRTGHGCEYVTPHDKTIQDIADLMINKMKEIGEPKSVGLAVAFIQGLPYIEDIYTGFDEYPKYPVETLIENDGDCEDTSYLTASLVEAMGFDAVLFILPGHMAVGIWSEDRPGTYVEYNGRDYYYLETTGSDLQIGEIPSAYKGVGVTVIDC